MTRKGEYGSGFMKISGKTQFYSQNLEASDEENRFQ